jgi:hypothetical protein
MAHIPKTVTLTGGLDRVPGPVARGFYLTPLTNENTGNPSQYPVMARINGDPATEVPISDGRAQYMALQVLDLVGRQKDRWRVTFLETEADGVGGGIPDATVSNVLAAKTSWASSECQYFTEYWLPGANGTVTTVTPGTEPATTLDVSGYSHVSVLVYNGALTVDPVTGTRPDLFVTLRPAVAESEPKSVGAAEIQVPAGQFGYFLLGPGLTSTVGFNGGNLVKVISQRFPWLRVSYQYKDFNAGATPQPNNQSQIRLVGLK